MIGQIPVRVYMDCGAMKFRAMSIQERTWMLRKAIAGLKALPEMPPVHGARMRKNMNVAVLADPEIVRFLNLHKGKATFYLNVLIAEYFVVAPEGARHGA
ncbi:hypothetical protein HAP94_05160 [Acidithiobacillus ferrivorans]|nr:hypothetical protein [Acidithiobacillus ferrivorans]